MQFCVKHFRLNKITSGMMKKNDCNRKSFFHNEMFRGCFQEDLCGKQKRGQIKRVLKLDLFCCFLNSEKKQASHETDQPIKA